MSLSRGTGHEDDVLHDGGQRRRRFPKTEDPPRPAAAAVFHAPAPPPPPPTPPTPRAILESAEVTSPLGGLRILTAAQDHEDVPSTGTNERSSSAAFSHERKQQNETRERHERVRLSTRRASLPPSFFLLLPSRLLPGALPRCFAFLFYCPLSLCLSSFLPLSLPPSSSLSFTASLSLRGPLSPPGVPPSLGSPYEIGHRTTLDEFPTSPRRVPIPPARDRRLTRPRESFGERIIKAPLRTGDGGQEGEEDGVQVESS